MSKKRIAVIAGDGIGKEVMPEGIRVMDAAARKFGIDLAFDHFDFSSWDYYEKHGQMLPDNWKDQIGGHDAIYFGAVGWPEKIADHVSLWGSLLMFRREFDQYIDFKDATANRQLPLAAPLQLHPLEESLSGNDYDWYFYKALPQEDSEYTFGPAEQAKLKIHWQILLDLTVTPGRLFRVGNHSL